MRKQQLGQVANARPPWTLREEGFHLQSSEWRAIWTPMPRFVYSLALRTIPRPLMGMWMQIPISVDAQAVLVETNETETSFVLWRMES